MVLLLALLACAPGTTPGASAEGRLVAGSLSWVTPLLPPPPGDLPALDRQRALLAIEAKADAVVAEHAAARAAAATTLYGSLASPLGASSAVPLAPDAVPGEAFPAPDVPAAVDTLVAADRAVWLAAVDASLAALALTPVDELAGRVTPASPVRLGAVDRLVRDQARLSIPPVEDLPSLSPAERDAVYAAERARTEALTAALTPWRDAVAAWSPGAPTDPLRAAALPLADAFAASARARPAVARLLLDALDDADRARTFVSPGLRAYVGAAPIGEEWGFAFHRDGPTPPDDAPPPGPAAQPQDAPPPEVHPPQEFPAGTGDPGAFPVGTGSPDVLPQGEPAPDGAAPPPEVHQNGPPPPPPPPPGVDPPPGVAGPPKEGGFNGMRPQP